MDQFESKDALLEALDELGEVLAERDEHYTLFVVGGAAILLQAPHLARSTADLDVAAVVSRGSELSRRIPEGLTRAVADVAKLLGLSPGWINGAAAASFPDLVPPGALERAHRLHTGGLTLLVADRLDLIGLKLQAALRRGEPGRRHRQDLLRLEPTPLELRDAADAALAAFSDPSAHAERVSSVLDELLSELGDA